MVCDPPPRDHPLLIKHRAITGVLVKLRMVTLIYVTRSLCSDLHGRLQCPQTCLMVWAEEPKSPSE